ncbi:hypothetical protein SAMN05216353_10422 [Halobacillus alkaliphilus]|uniref:Uncharacterized protein n=1 Tax=Halobacillus alkaliphilus TaxID=396056 RepID=A0A1I2KB21_9BACI|nr:hypothetical protein [Halobacillus alkaliphilus]SFF64144.1 hypothetical protein SAMN05216353_10422 [Halobacillus alkaliphilus]
MTPRNTARTDKEKNRDIGSFIFVLASIIMGPYLYNTFSIPVNIALVLVTYVLLQLVIGWLSNN